MASESFKEALTNVYVTRVRLGKSFESQKAILENVLDDPLLRDSTLNENANDDAVSGLVNILNEHKESLAPKRRDTSVGGNDAINCYYQFNEDDDIIHSINRVGNQPGQGLGRVYNEVFDEQQQILYMSFGVPQFANITSFLEYAYNTDLATIMNTGGDASTLGAIGRFVGRTLGTVILLPFLPLRYAVDLIVQGWTTPSRYYDFRPTMALYYKMVNVILAHLAVNMELAEAVPDAESDGEPVPGSPNLLRFHGLDILTMLSRRWHFDRLGQYHKESSPTADEFMEEISKNPNFEEEGWAGTLKAVAGSVVGNFGTGLAMGLTEAMKFVGFRIEKSVDSSESASNTTKETELARLINQQASAGRDRTFNLAALRETAPGQVVDSIFQSVKGVVEGAAESFKMTGGVEVLKGSGYVDIPEVWESSSFTKSYSFDFQLRTPMADKFSIFYSLYIPLAMLIAGAFPRAVGRNAYTSPFIVRAYCKGMFAIPLGIIDSITIKRGAPEYGWSREMLPTQIDVSFSIKDLSPVMYVALSDGGIKEWANILGQNSTFQEYLLTLSGVNVAQRTLRFHLIQKRAKALLRIMAANKLNPMMQGLSLTDTKLGRLFNSLSPVSRLPGRVPPPVG